MQKEHFQRDDFRYCFDSPNRCALAQLGKRVTGNPGASGDTDCFGMGRGTGKEFRIIGIYRGDVKIAKVMESKLFEELKSMGEGVSEVYVTFEPRD